MSEINLQDFENQIVIRQMQIADFDSLIQTQLNCFPGMQAWKMKQIESQLEIFPEGQIVIEYEGKIVASSSSLILDINLYGRECSWKDFTDNGFIRNHDPNGDTLYGVEIMVDPEYRGMKLARRLYDMRKKLAIENNVKRMVVGGRIPGYSEHAHEMNAREYVDKVVQKILIDPVLTVQIANGFVLKRLIPDYMTKDKESGGYATLLEWSNLDYVPNQQNSLPVKSSGRVCIVQMSTREFASFEEFANVCEFFVDSASEYKSDFIVFPEEITFQLLGLLAFDRPALGLRQLAEFTTRYLEMFTALSVKYNVNIVGGSHLSIENEKLFNIAYLFRRDGTLGKQAKMHIAPNEVRWWGLFAGDQLEVFDTDCGKIAIQIGSDIEFPEASRIAAKKGAEIIFVPFAVEERYADLRIRNCAKARAIENHVYVITAGMVGIIPKMKYFDIRHAQSGVYAPVEISYACSGVQTDCPPNVETVLFEELDLNSLRKSRQSETHVFREKRRDELFPF